MPATEQPLNRIAAHLAALKGDLEHCTAGNDKLPAALQENITAVLDQIAEFTHQSRAVPPSSLSAAAPFLEPQNRLNQVLASITDAYFALDDEWRFVVVNPVAARDLFGDRPVEQLLGKVIWEVYPQAVGQTFYQYYYQAVRDRQPLHFEAKCLIVNAWFEAQVYPREGYLEIFLRNITQRKFAEGQLNASEQRARDLIRHAPTGIYEIDFRSQRFKSVNDVICQYLGYTRDELLALDPFALLDEPGKKLFQERIRQRLAGEPVDESAEYRVIGKNGRVVHAILNVTFTVDPDGKPEGAMVIAHDISERRKTEQQLKRLLKENRVQRSLLDSIFDADPSGLAVVVGPDLRFVYTNPVYRMIAPILLDDFTGQSYATAWPCPEWDEHHRMIQQVLRTGKPFQVQGLERVYSKDTSRIFTLQARRLEWDGQPGALLILWDTTEASQSERRLRESEEEYRSFFDLGTFGAAQVDPATGHLLRVNGRFCQITGYTQTELLKKSIRQLTHPEDRNADWELFNRMVRGETTEYQNEKRYIRKDNQVIWVHSAARLVYDAAGKPVRTSGIIADITQRKQAELERERILAENRQQSELFETVIEKVPLGIALLQCPDYRFVLVNSTFATHRSSKHSLLGHTFQEIYPHLADQFIPALRHVCRTGETLNGDDIPITIATKSGQEEIYISFAFVPLFTPEHEVDRILVVVDDTSHQVHDRQTIESERARLSAILANAPTAIIATDAKGKMVLANFLAEELFSQDVPPAQGEQLPAPSSVFFRRDGSSVDSPEQFLSEYALQGETVINQEVFLELANGQRQYFTVNSAPILNSTGEISGAVGLFRDITNLRTLEKDLGDSENQLRTTLDHLPIGAWIANPSGEIIYGNHASKLIWGGEKYVGMDQFGEYKAWWVETGKLIEPHEWAMARAVQHGETSLNELIEIECFDGTHKIILNSAVPVYGRDGELLCAVSLNEDITERRKILENLQTSQERYQTLFNRMVEGFALHEMIYDQDGKAVDFRYLEINPAFELITGLTREKVLGHTALEILPDLEPHWIETYARVAGGGEPVQFEDYNRSLDKHFQVSAFSPEKGKFAALFVEIKPR